MEYETGARTAAANDLVLTVMNDGAVYRDRAHAVFAEMQSASHRGLQIPDIVRDAAARMRKQFGSKFPARDVSEAARIVRAQTLVHCLETVRDEWNGERIEARALLWLDRANGNTYHSVRLQIPNGAGGRIVDIPMAYGYGDQWKETAIQALRKIGFTLPESVPPWQLPINWGSATYTPKREMFRGISF